LLVARKKSAGLTDAELRLMDVLWERGSGTVSDVVEALAISSPLHYSTVLTTLRILETKGYLKHVKEGRAFVYKAVVGKEQARAGAVTHLLRRFFEGSPELLVLNLVQQKKIDPQEFSRIQERIERAETPTDRKKEKKK
jgi:predicted transcriptional regulator